MLDVEKLSYEELYILDYYLLEYCHNRAQQNFVDAYKNMRKVVRDEWDRREARELKS